MRFSLGECGVGYLTTKLCQTDTLLRSARSSGPFKRDGVEDTFFEDEGFIDLLNAGQRRGYRWI